MWSKVRDISAHSATKEPRNSWLFCCKMTCNLRHPVGLRHSSQCVRYLCSFCATSHTSLLFSFCAMTHLDCHITPTSHSVWYRTSHWLLFSLCGISHTSRLFSQCVRYHTSHELVFSFCVTSHTSNRRLFSQCVRYHTSHELVLSECVTSHTPRLFSLSAISLLFSQCVISPFSAKEPLITGLICGKCVISPTFAKWAMLHAMRRKVGEITLLTNLSSHCVISLYHTSWDHTLCDFITLVEITHCEKRYCNISCTQREETRSVRCYTLWQDKFVRSVISHTLWEENLFWQCVIPPTSLLIACNITVCDLTIFRKRATNYRAHFPQKSH